MLHCLTRIFAILKPPKTLKLWHLSRILKYLMNQNTYINIYTNICTYICVCMYRQSLLKAPECQSKCS